VGAFGADGGVVAVAGVEVGVVGEDVEESELDVVDQGLEVLWAVGLAHSAREHAVAGEPVLADGCS
jgi:hypothetical protein